MWSQAFVRSLRTRRYAPRTIRAYDASLRRFDAWLHQHRGRGVRQATVDDLMDYGDTLPFSYASRQNLINAYKAWWRHHLGRGAECPAEAVRQPAKPDGFYRGLDSSEDARRLIEAAGQWGVREQTACALLYYAALRVEEAATLERGADLGDWLDVMGKGAKPRRVPILDELRAHLDAYTASLNGSRWVFPGKSTEGHVHPNTIGRWVGLAGAAAGLGHVTAHMLRETAGATIHDTSGDLRGTGEFLGHSKHSLEVTASIYTRTRQMRLRALAAAL